MTFGGESGYSQQAIPLYPCISSSISLYNAKTVPFVFLFPSVYRVLVHCSGSYYNGRQATQQAGLWVTFSVCTVWFGG